MYESLIKNRFYDHCKTLCPQIGLYDFVILEKAMKLHCFYPCHTARDAV